MDPLFEHCDLASAIEKVAAGARLAPEDGLRLYESHDLHALGYMANLVRERKHGNRAYYIINRHINYSNICILSCQFCAFGKKRREAGSYELGREEILERGRRAVAAGVTEIHMVGGLSPYLPWHFYVDILEGLRSLSPRLHIKAFTAIEIRHLAWVGDRSISDTLLALRDAGLGSLTGGGAEIFDAEVRAEICRGKETAEEWLDIHRTAHRLGLRSTATMLYGHIEEPRHRVDHLTRLRRLQDETGGFTAFVPLAFHPANTQLTHLPGPTGYDDLKNLAIARVYLDNFDHIKAYWIMQGVKLAQVSLGFGVDDIDGTVMEERIYHMAGARTPEELTREELVALIREAGRDPVQRDSLYAPVPASPVATGAASAPGER